MFVLFVIISGTLCQKATNSTTHHAEDQALRNLQRIKLNKRIERKTLLRGFNIVVFRMSRTYMLGNSRPCERKCMKLIRKRRNWIRNVYFSNSEGNIEKLDL